VPSFVGVVGDVALIGAAVGAVLVALSRQTSRRFGGALALLAIVSGGLRWAAAGPSWTAVALVVGIGGFWLFDRGIPGNRPRPAWLRLAALLLVVVAAAVAMLTILGLRAT